MPGSISTSMPRPLAPGSEPAIEVINLEKTYGNGVKAVKAVAGISFTVAAGTVFGLLGPNGAGKSTTVRILTTLSRADSGTARVAGVDVEAQPAQVRQLIGYVPQKSCFDPIGTGTENLMLQARVFGSSRSAAADRASELLERFGLADVAHRLAGKWSGGMQRKLDVALGLVHRPHVLFLDEPTTGLDPEARTDMWAEIARLSGDDGLTVLLTTHYLDEADRLADALAIIDDGAVVAAGSPSELKQSLDGDTVLAELAAREDGPAAAELLRRLAGVRDVTVAGAVLRARVSDGPASLPKVLAALDAAGLALAAVTVARPSLDDVYLRHAGRAYREAGPSGLGSSVSGAALEQVGS